VIISAPVGSRIRENHSIWEHVSSVLGSPEARLSDPCLRRVGGGPRPQRARCALPGAPCCAWHQDHDWARL